MDPSTQEHIRRMSRVFLVNDKGRVRDTQMPIGKEVEDSFRVKMPMSL